VALAVLSAAILKYSVRLPIGPLFAVMSTLLVAMAFVFVPVTETVEDFARHHGCSVLPARPRHPQDTAKVESAAQVVEPWILMRLRHQRFDSVDEVNEAIQPLLEPLNSTPFSEAARQPYERVRRCGRPGAATAAGAGLGMGPRSRRCGFTATIRGDRWPPVQGAPGAGLPSASVHAARLEDVLGQIDADARNLHGGRSLR